jgi:hypothetical protein
MYVCVCMYACNCRHRVLHIIIISSETALYEPQPSLEDSARFDPVSTSLDLATIYFFQSKVVSFATNPQPGGPGLYIYVPQ